MAKITKARKAELYTQHVALARHLARKFSRTYRLDYAEMQEEAEGLLRLCIAEWAFDPSKGCNETSYIYRRLSWDLLTLCTRRLQGQWVTDPATGEEKFLPCKQFSVVSSPDEPGPRVAAPEPWYERLMRDLSDEARTLVYTILEAPAEIAEDVRLTTEVRARRAVRSYLQEQGWGREKIEAAWGEVEAAL